ncbi:hypothetical protein [Dictyobacter aurantiacus]|uniref:Uncharacterized protein n=1 Tax=Dictyobacter aurantiacus TaxID=1936993 RepID=A0A401ZG67_9CHLR|nr:hypothetical protein [Dictyobacter aurantiacus]GCE05839.1 hypothetical protein KDAU_31680 [Dictyobacter aurantiacus]
MSHSEVALLRKKILEEYEAMERGLTGLASGTAKHAFIDARMRRVDRYHDQLTQYVGETEATLTVCELYIQAIG